MSWLWGSNKEPKPEKRKRVTQLAEVSNVADPKPSLLDSVSTAPLQRVGVREVEEVHPCFQYVYTS